MATSLKPSEVSDILLGQLQDMKNDLQFEEIGKVLQVSDGVVRIYGLDHAEAGELLDCGEGVMAVVMNLEADNVGAVLMGPTDHIKEGMVVRRTGRIASIGVCDKLLGRVVDPLGSPLDGLGPVEGDKIDMPLERKAPGVIYRQPVSEPLQTGLKAIDAMIPIGRGQRELIIGDRQTGKTSIAIDTIINQRAGYENGDPVYCIYVAIGQKASTVATIVETLRQHKAMDYTVVIAATAGDSAAMRYYAPFAGAAVGEYFRDTGRHALVIYDDLSKQAVAYREVSLILRRPSGREAYPGDVFYLHSRLLERACKLSKENGGGSLTALPIIETQANDVSAYIPTNVISITDGQIYLESSLFLSGVKPAINVGLSVSRVGGSAQRKTMRKVAGTLRVDMSQYQELAGFAQFGSELDKESQRQIERGKRMSELLKQGQYKPMRLSQQVLVLYAGVHGYTDNIAVEQVRAYEEQLLAWADVQHKQLMDKLDAAAELTDELTVSMDDALTQFQTIFHGKK